MSDAFRFVVSPATHTEVLRFVAETSCVVCEKPMRVAYGEPTAMVRIGTEFLGTIGDCCLSTEGRDLVRQRRLAAQGK